VAADPLREETQHSVIRLLAAQGETEAARAEYRQFERLLRRELDAAPSPELRAFVEQLETEIRPAGKPIPRRSASPLLPAASTPPSPIGYLPRQLTRFFGREREIAAVREMLLDADSALVTLTGPGGTGKSRLALQVAQKVREAYQGAAWFVPLQDLAGPWLIFDRVLEILRLPRSAEIEPLEQIVGFLSSQRSLLVLDNFEHLVEGEGGRLQQLLEQVQTLTVLATSRQLLGADGEQEFSVSPLPIPMEHGSIPQLLENESVQLFVDRAQVVQSDFQLTARGAVAVATLCARLEGLPLTIELAAARIRVLTPVQMLERLQERFTLLARPRQVADPRHQSLRAALDWSYHLLSSDLQRFFAGLSIFRGGWSLAAAATVVGAHTDGAGEIAALDSLSQLRDAYLVLADDHGKEVRFRLLETLREYADSNLSAAERSTLARRHVCYYQKLLEGAERALEPLTELRSPAAPLRRLWLRNSPLAGSVRGS
jgi:predicted ATPase